MIEKRLYEVFFADDILKELLRTLDEPEGKYAIKISAKCWVQVSNLLLQVRVRLFVEGNQFIKQ